MGWEVKVHRYEELSVGGEEWVKNVHGMHIESEMKWRRCPTNMCQALHFLLLCKMSHTYICVQCMVKLCT